MTPINAFEELTRAKRKQIEKQIDEWEKQIKLLEEKVQKECVKVEECRSTKNEAFKTYMQEYISQGYQVLQAECWDEVAKHRHGFRIYLLHSTHTLFVNADIDMRVDGFHSYDLAISLVAVEGRVIDPEAYEHAVERLKTFVQEDLESIPAYRLKAVTSSDWMEVVFYRDLFEFNEIEKSMYDLIAQGHSAQDVGKMARVGEEEHGEFMRKLGY